MKLTINKIKNKIHQFIKEGFYKEDYNKYNDMCSWETDLYKIVEKWLEKMPIIPITETYKHPILAYLLNVKVSSTIQSWQTAALVEGAMYFDKSNKINKIVDKYIDNNGNWKSEPDCIDFAFLSFMFMKYYDDPAKIKPAMKYMCHFIYKNIMYDGTVCYRSNMSKYRLVDTLGFICPFLVKYGNLYNDKKAIKLAHLQMKEYIKYGVREKGIPYHAYNTDNNECLGANAWSRGIAWYILGLESFINDSKYQKIMLSLADTLITYQKRDGGFSWLINFEGSCETSGTSVIGNLFIDCYEFTGEQKYIIAAENCIKALMKSTTSNGTINFAQGDTKSIGLYSQDFSFMPFAQGYSLKLVSRIINLNN